MLAHWNSSWEDTSRHSDTLSWFWSIQAVFAPNLYAACLMEKQHVPIAKFAAWLDLNSTPRSPTLEADTLTTPLIRLHYTLKLTKGVLSGMSEWLFLAPKWEICQLYHGENKLHFDVRLVLDQHTLLICIVLVHRNNSAEVDISSHPETLLWFRANQSMNLLLSVACLAKKLHITILYFLVSTKRGSNPGYITLAANTTTITSPMLLYVVRQT